MHRRTLLGALAAVVGGGALAGCSDPPAYTALRLSPATDEAVVEGLSTPIADLRAERAAYAEQLFADDSLETIERYDPAIRDGTVFRDSERFRWIETTHLGESSVTVYTFEITKPATGTAADDDGRETTGEDVEPSPEPVRTVAFGDLPVVDRRTLRRAHLGEMAEIDDRAGDEVHRRADDVDPEASVLVGAGGPVAVTRRGTRYVVTVTGPENEEFDQYRYRARSLATDRASFVATMRDAYEFELAPDSEEQREILDAALGRSTEHTTGPDGGYREEEPLSDAFEALLEGIVGHARPGWTHPQRWLATDEGRGYVLVIERRYMDPLTDRRSPEPPGNASAADVAVRHSFDRTARSR